MSTCGRINSNILIDCDNPLVGGSNDRLILINKDDWDLATITRDQNNNQLITNIVLASGAVGYIFEGKNNSVEPRQALVKQRYAEVYDHEVIFKVFKADPSAKQQLERLAKGKVVAVVENNWKGDAGSGAFEVYGEETGLFVQELERTLADADTQGAYNVNLRTSEQAKESHLPASLWSASYAATKQIVDSLLA